MFYKSKKENLPGQDIPHKTIKINLSTLIILIILTIIIAVGSTILIIKHRNNKQNKIEQDNSKLFTEHNNYIHSYFGL